MESVLVLTTTDVVVSNWRDTEQVVTGTKYGRSNRVWTYTQMAVVHDVVIRD